MDIAEEHRNLNSVVVLNAEKLAELKHILNISLKIKICAESGRDEAADEISVLTDMRGEHINAMKNIDAGISHYSMKLQPKYSNILDKVKDSVKYNRKITNDILLQRWSVDLYKSMMDQKSVLNKIKEADELNNAKIKELIEQVKDKINSLKNNKTLMKKYNFESNVKTGTLFNQKK